MSLEQENHGVLRLVTSAMRRYVMMLGMFALPFSSLRVLLLRCCGVTIGPGCYIGFNVMFDTNYPTLIRIGRNVTISHNVAIYTHTATPAASPLGRAYRCIKPVSVGDGAWIAANSMLLPGVEVGPNCMIGAGAVVTKSTEADSLYAGNPARKVKALSLPDGAR